RATDRGLHRPGRPKRERQRRPERELMVERDRVVEGYAAALLSVAEAEDAVDEVEDELFRFGRALESASDLRDALIDPALPVERKVSVDPEVIGGAVARVGDQVFDGTVRSRLEAARERLGSG